MTGLPKPRRAGLLCARSFRISVLRISVLGLSALGLVHCSNHDPEVERMGGEPLPDAGSGGSSSGPPVQWCDVERIIMLNCLGCHADPPQYGPFPLTSYAATQAEYPPDSGMRVYQAMGRAVGSGFMPLVGSGLPVDVEPLSESDKDIVVTWAEQGGMLVGEADCPDVAPPLGGAGGGGGAG